MDFLADVFGYILNYIYIFVKNYGLAIILFSILLKLLMLPLTIKQQKTMKKTMKIQEQSKEIQNKYKDNPEKMNQEIMELYKKENMSPFSGCLSAIVQIVLLFSIFYLVRSPLTHMVKIEPDVIKEYETEIKTNDEENKKNSSYPEIAIIKYAREKLASGDVDEDKKQTYEQMAVNMDFLGLDLSNVPTEDMSNPTVFVIPALYVISSFVSIKISSNNGKKKEETTSEKSEADPVANANKSMLWFMPIMSISIAIIAPLGLALYWLVNNILMIIERIVMNAIFNKNEEEA